MHTPEPFNLSKYRKAGKASKASSHSRKKHGKYKGTEHIPRTVFNGWMKRATRDGIRFLLSIDDIERLWLEQNGHCVVTGRPLTLTTNDPSKVSLDRINSNGDYQFENVRLVCSVVNFVRHTLTDDELRAVLKDMQRIDDLRRAGSAHNWFGRLSRREYQRIFGRDPPPSAATNGQG